LQQLVAIEHSARLLGQRIEQVEFTRRQVDLRAVALNFAPLGVDLQLVEVQRRPLQRRRLAPTRAGYAAASQDGLDTDDELARAEGLGQVVVGADREANDLVDLLGARG